MSAREENPKTETPFYPSHVFTSIITKECVEQELRRVFPYEKSESIASMTDRVHGNTAAYSSAPGRSSRNKITRFRRIFAILILLKETKEIKQFLKTGVNDSDLPLMKVKRPNERMAYDLCRQNEIDSPIEFITLAWDNDTIEQFWHRQWTMLSPFFAQRRALRKVWHYKLQREVILPFIGCETKVEKHIGGSAQVSRVVIHDKHHSFHTREVSIAPDYS